MFDHIERFYQPTTLREALLLLRKVGKRGRIVAGATDIVTQADRSTRFLIDITRLGLNYVRGNQPGMCRSAPRRRWQSSNIRR